MEPPKHRSVITFKGLTYRYDATYGEFHLVEKKTRLRAPRTIRFWGDTQWEADGAKAKTPLGALQFWLRSLIALRTREAKEAEQQAKALRREVKQLSSKASWKLSTPPVNR